MGRGHDADIRVTDISVSRFHARINKSLITGEFYVEDNKSKFGTLMQIRKPILLKTNIANYIQMGRTSLKIMIDDPESKISKEDEEPNCCEKMLSCFQDDFKKSNVSKKDKQVI